MKQDQKSVSDKKPSKFVVLAGMVFDSMNYGKRLERPFGALESDAIKRLYEAFAMDCTEDEACLHANVSKTDFLKYVASSEGEEFMNNVKFLRNAPALIARETAVMSLDDLDMAKWYLERKRDTEFNKKYDGNINITGKFDNLSDGEIEDRIAGEVSKALGAIAGEKPKGNK